MSGTYDFAAIEPTWQQYWQQRKTFKSLNPGDPGFDASKPKYYVLDMFPYPSGAGLHVGHPEGYTATDIMARYKRMKGFNVLHPMGYDSFGLPAEQYAVEHGVHPRVTTEQNISNIRQQIKSLGFSYDWDRELATTDVGYYGWTQWIFLQLFKHWYDEAFEWTDESGRQHTGKARPIADLPIPDEVLQQGDAAVATYKDEHRLAYLAEVPVNWCPALGTVLANEEVTNDGRSDRGNHPVYRRPLKQWMLRITTYAQRLMDDLELLNWPESIKAMQRNWIGRSEGADVDFPLADPSTVCEGAPAVDAWFGDRAKGELPSDAEPFVIRVYTTRPDTLFGATYMVLAPEHPLVGAITTDGQREAVQAYIDVSARKTDLDRTDLAKEKTGVFTGAYAVNPVTREPVPIWVADYVLMSYGTGAIMAVPAHDERDFEFAKTFDLPIVAVVQPPAGWVAQQGKTNMAAYLANPGALDEAFCDVGVSVHSPIEPIEGGCEINGLATSEAKAKITDWLGENGLGRGAVNFKLRDWLFSRQRYWGEPFPILHGPDGEIVAMGEQELPLELPELDDFTPTSSADNRDALPEPPLSRATDWVTVERDGKAYRRELNTMPQWAGSCWYYLRYLSPDEGTRFCSTEAEKYWMPVDLYVGGAEHAVLHLLYARFWHKVLFDLGAVGTVEPFGELFNQGMIRAFAYRDSRGVCIGYDEIDFRKDGAYHKQTGEALVESIEKMSKSLKNVINPNEVIAEYGADTLRLYEMYMGPLETSKPWNTRDVPGVHRFLHRAWRLVVDPETGGLSDRLVDAAPDEVVERLVHRTIKSVEQDVEAMRFNTAIAHLIVFVNEMTPLEQRPRSAVERFVLLLAPLAPHIAEELWARLGHAETLAYEPWPAMDAALAQEPEVEIAVQIKGKLCTRLTVPADADAKQLEEAAMADEKVQAAIEGKTVRKVICVPGRLVNIVAT